MWCDSYNNVIRALDRQGLRDVDYRVAFQMNATDSSNLIDTPLATRLGVHRAILYNEGREPSKSSGPTACPRTSGWQPYVPNWLPNTQRPIPEQGSSWRNGLEMGGDETAICSAGARVKIPSQPGGICRDSSRLRSIALAQPFLLGGLICEFFTDRQICGKTSRWGSRNE